MAQNHIKINDIKDQVLAFMEHLGITPIGHDLIIDGSLHRYRTEGDRAGETSGAYCIYPDGWPAGFVQDWRKGIKADWKFDTSTLSDDIRAHLESTRRATEKLQKRREKEREEQAMRASETARVFFEQMPLADDTHPYLVRKHVRSYGLKCSDTGSLAVPLRDVDGRFRTLQWIPEEGLKQFFYGATVTGAFWSIALDVATPDQPILIGEGYATMAKVYELTGLPCVAAMTCYGLKPVAEAIKGKYRDFKIIIMADNDSKTDGNPGIAHAKRACESLKLLGYIAPPPQVGTDWDDYAIEYGDEEAQRAIGEKIRWLGMSESERQAQDRIDQVSTMIRPLDPSLRLPEQEFIGGLLPRGYISAIVAPPGTGKTMLLQKLVSDLSIGGPIFDGLAENEPSRKSLIFAGEAGYDLMIRRGAATQWPVNPRKVLILDQYTVESAGLSISLDSAEGWTTITGLVKKHHPDVVFFDTLSSYHDRDENSAAEVKPILRKLASLARECQCAVVVVHHSRKRTSRDRALPLSQDDVIGSSIFSRLVAVIIGVEPQSEDEKILMVKPLKTWFKPFEIFTFRLAEDLDGRPTLDAYPGEPSSLSRSEQVVEAYLRQTFTSGTWFALSDIKTKAISPTTSIWQVKRALGALVSSGSLLKKSSRRYTQYCFAE